MKVEQVHPLRIQTTPMDGRRITRLFLDDHELAAEPWLLEAAARLAIGAPLNDLQIRRLTEIGVLVPVGPPANVPDRLALRPEVAIDVLLRPREVQLPGARGTTTVSVLPGHTLPIDLFIAPLRLGALQRLARKVEAAWTLISRAAQGRGQAVDPDRATPVLAQIAAEALAEDGAAQLTLEEAGGAPYHLRPVAPLQDDQIHYPIEILAFHGDRVRPIAAGQKSWRFRPESEAEWSVATAMLGLLGHGVHGGEATAALGPEINRVALLLRGLLLSNLLGSPPKVDAVIDPPDGGVLHLGHATLLARLGDDRVLIDPWFPPASASDRVRPFTLLGLPPLSAILLTHHHWDHLNLETLLKLDKRVPIYVPRQREGALIAPKSEAVLRYLGFQDVRVMGHGDELVLSRGRVVALPFYGEDPTRIGFEGNTYLLEQEGRSALVHVDSGTDALGRSMVSTGALAQAVARYGPIHTVFATRRQERGTMLEYGWPFLLRPADEWARPAENACNDAAFLGALCATAGARHLVLYSEGGTDAYPTDTDFLRGSGPRARDTALTFGWDDQASIERAASEAGARTTLSKPGDLYAL